MKRSREKSGTGSGPCRWRPCILWVVGYRISDYYKITDETEHILEAEVILPGGGEPEGGRQAGIWNCKGEKTMADKIRVLLNEEEVDRRIKKRCGADQQGL